jgi:hypothetical protein
MKLNGKNIITDGDVIVTSPSVTGKTLESVITEQQSDINRLKSNVKYIYSYGGVGGTGTGNGSSSGTDSSSATLYAEFDNKEIGDNPILLNGEGKYTFYAKVRKSAGATYYLRVAVGDNPNVNMATKKPLSIELNGCEYTETFNLSENGKIIVQLLDTDNDVVDRIEQNYILHPHEFSSVFKYRYNGGKNTSEVSNNEYTMGATEDIASDPYIEMSYKVNVTNPTGIKLTYTIGDFYSGVEELSVVDNTTKPFRIEFKELTRNSKDLLIDDNAGTYHVTTTLSYTSLGSETSETIEYDITLIPSYLFINVRPDKSVIYQTQYELESDIVGETPKKNINPGEFVSFFLTVYDGSLANNVYQYDVKCNVYDYINGSFDENAGLTKSMIVSERSESLSGLSFSFSTSGIKKLVFSTTSPKNAGKTCTNTLFLYVKEPTNSIGWDYKANVLESYYFRANQGDNTYSANFPKLSSGNSPLELKTTSSPITLKESAWRNPSGTTTMLAIGVQISKTNSDNCKILDIYYPTGNENADESQPTYSLRTKKLFEETDYVNDILIPTEDNYNIANTSNYHLIQIFRQFLGYDGTTQCYADLLYIDGVVECCNQNTKNISLKISKIILNNINISYNLINLQYINSDTDKNGKPNLNLDGLAYKYYLSYKEKCVNVSSDTKIDDDESIAYQAMDSMKFDGSNVITTFSTVQTIAQKLSIPTMVFDYCPGSETDESGNKIGTPLTSDETGEDTGSWQYLMKQFLKGYKSGESNVFGTKKIDLLWCPGKVGKTEYTFQRISVPEINGLTGYWEFGFQGTSTMTNRIKNFTLSLITNTNEKNEHILFSPNFKKGTTDEARATFLPEREWTIKADIADSAHANNTCVGKFVNKVCSKFNIGTSLSTEVASRIRNCLEGFPVLMFFRCDSDDRVYYFGVYNFNLGRSSEYNLGYTTDIEEVYNRCGEATDTNFAFTYGKCESNSNLAVGEIQDNQFEFDFSQYQESLLFKGDQATDDRGRMFGADSKITAANKGNAKITLQRLVEGVARAGRYVFQQVGKTFGENSEGYKNKNQVPDTKKQLRFVNGNDEYVEGFELGEVTDLLKLITTQSDVKGEISNTPLLNYASASEYYTICMAFGLVDSVLKNMNLKSWDGTTCYCAFYDMDCAFGEANDGKEKISYLAATDQWHSTTSTDGYLQPVTVDYDYWDDSIGMGIGYDFTSSYLFGVVKYAQAIFSSNNDLKNLNLENFPQEFWAKLRCGELKNVDYFMENYYSSGIHKIPSYLASLDYRVKYLYKGQIYDELKNEYIEKFIANVDAFHGTRKHKVRDWLNNRIKFLDVVMNINNLTLPLVAGINLPKHDKSTEVGLNSDIAILNDAFATNEYNRVCSSFTDLTVQIQAPKNTPFILTKGGDTHVYLLNADETDFNKLKFTTISAVVNRYYGSKSFISIDRIEPFLTTAAMVISDKLTSVKWGGYKMSTITSGLNVTSSTVEEIYLPVSNFSGELKIDKDNGRGESITSIDISGSGLYGDFLNLHNLKTLKFNGVNATSGDINIGGHSKNMTTGDLSISGESAEAKTKLNSLSITKVPGDYSLVNTAIQTIAIESDGVAGRTFKIDGDETLTTLSLSNFETVIIKNCSNLVTLTINGNCKTLHINGNTSASKTYTDGKLVTINSTTSGEYNLTELTSLNTLTIQQCNGMEILKLPNKSVSIGSSGLSNNMYLKYIDTTSGDNSKVEICGTGVFYNCPLYSMRANETDYTKMSVKSTVTSLANTFSIGWIGTNSDTLDMKDVRHFVEDVVSDQMKPKIQSFASCFNDRTHIVYDINSANTDEANRIAGTLTTDSRLCPDFTGYTSLNNISSMFWSCNVSFLYREMFNFGNNTSALNWDGYANSGAKNMSTDSLYYISKRITTFGGHAWNYKNTYTIYKWDTSKNEYVITGTTKDTAIKMVDVLMPQQDHASVSYDDNGWDTNTNLKIFSYFEFNSSQYVDLSNIFKLYPNVTTIENFLNGDLRKYKYGGLLSDCKNLTSVKDSFNHNNVNTLSECEEIDLSGFFNWEANTNIYNLFASGDATYLGFISKKTVSYTNMVDIMSNISKKKQLTSLTNIFSYCTITNYNNEEIEFTDKNTKITSLNYLFYKCKSDYGEFGQLKFASSFFENIPNVTSLVRTFYGVNLGSMFGMDFFKKRKETTTNVYIVKNGQDSKLDASWDIAKLHSFEYNKVISNLTECFAYVKFVDCKNWFDPQDHDMSSIETDYIDYNGDTETYKNYYKSRSSSNIYTFNIKGEEYGIKTSNIIFEENETIDTIKDRGDLYCVYNDEDYYYYGYQYCSDSDSDSDALIQVIKINNNNIKNAEKVKINDNSYYRITLLRYNNYSYSNAYTITTNTEISDLDNNYTHYISNFSVTYNKNIFNFYNHDYTSDLNYYNNSNYGNPLEESSFNLYKTYCCLPPDILYGCSNNAQLTGVFMDTNIIGVMPLHLTKNCQYSSLANAFKNINLMPNLEYLYNSTFKENNEFEGYFDNVPIVEQDKSKIPTESLDMNSNACVFYRDSDGILCRRHPKMATEKDDEITESEKEKAQYLYIPINFTKSGSINYMFNFRYNLPASVFISEKTNKSGDDAVTSRFDQYFFIHKESVNWNLVTNAVSPFISSDDDKRYSDNSKRSYYSTDMNANSWWKTNIVQSWDNINNGVFNVFLNLCCSTVDETRDVVDNGCPINLANNIKLNNFLNGVIMYFICGRVFQHDVLMSDMTSSNNLTNASNYILNAQSGSTYDAFRISKNIQLPMSSSTLKDTKLRFIYDNVNGYTVLLKCFVDEDVNSISGYDKLTSIGGRKITWAESYRYDYTKSGE